MQLIIKAYHAHEPRVEVPSAPLIAPKLLHLRVGFARHGTHN